MRATNAQSGHTLLELLVALANLALAAAAAWPSFDGARERVAGRAFAQALQDELAPSKNRSDFGVICDSLLG